MDTNTGRGMLVSELTMAQVENLHVEEKRRQELLLPFEIATRYAIKGYPPNASQSWMAKERMHFEEGLDHAIKKHNDPITDFKRRLPLRYKTTYCGTPQSDFHAIDRFIGPKGIKVCFNSKGDRAKIEEKLDEVIPF